MKDEIESKNHAQRRRRGKKSKTISEVKPVENKNLQSFLKIRPMQKEVISHKLQDHTYEC